MTGSAMRISVWGAADAGSAEELAFRDCTAKHGAVDEGVISDPGGAYCVVPRRRGWDMSRFIETAHGVKVEVGGVGQRRAGGKRSASVVDGRDAALTRAVERLRSGEAVRPALQCLVDAEERLQAREPQLPIATMKAVYDLLLARDDAEQRRETLALLEDVAPANEKRQRGAPRNPFVRELVSRLFSSADRDHLCDRCVAMMVNRWADPPRRGELWGAQHVRELRSRLGLIEKRGRQGERMVRRRAR